MGPSRGLFLGANSKVLLGSFNGPNSVCPSEHVVVCETTLTLVPNLLLSIHLAMGTPPVCRDLTARCPPTTAGSHRHAKPYLGALMPHGRSIEASTGMLKMDPGESLRKERISGPSQWALLINHCSLDVRHLYKLPPLSRISGIY